MKKLIICFLAAACIIMTACSEPVPADSATTEMPPDYGRVIEIAKEEFETVFKDYENLDIIETVTATRNDDENMITVRFGYTSDNGDGQYGLAYLKTERGEYLLLRQGEDINEYSELCYDKVSE